MFGYEANEYDIKVYNEELKDFLPEKIIDTHNHVSKKEFRLRKSTHWTAAVYGEGCPIEDLTQTYLDLFPGKKLKGVIMPSPSWDLEKGNAYIAECIKNGETGLFCTKYDTTAQELEDAILNKGFKDIGSTF